MSELTDRIDRFGHCCCCGKNLLTKRVVDGKVVDMFTPFYDETIFLLENGSQMQITICKTCKSTTDLNSPKVQNNIMDACIKGWELETKMLVADEKYPDWTEEKGKEYINTMKKLNINCNSENLDKYTLQNKVIELKNLEVLDIQAEVIK